MGIAHQRAAADHRAVSHRQQADDSAAPDLLDLRPDSTFGWLMLCGRNRKSVRRKLLREGQHRGFVRARHHA